MMPPNDPPLGPVLISGSALLRVLADLVPDLVDPSAPTVREDGHDDTFNCPQCLADYLTHLHHSFDPLIEASPGMAEGVAMVLTMWAQYRMEAEEIRDEGTPITAIEAITMWDNIMLALMDDERLTAAKVRLETKLENEHG